MGNPELEPPLGNPYQQDVLPSDIVDAPDGLRLHICRKGCKPGSCPAIWILHHDRTRTIQDVTDTDSRGRVFFRNGRGGPWRRLRNAAEYGELNRIIDRLAGA